MHRVAAAGRRGARRERNDRREELRFEPAKDARRERADRRKRTDGDWNDK